jgi:histidyl-tRNA synthetase
LGKYGDEGDRLIFRILNSGEKLKKADLDALANENLPRFANSLSEKALRYDLTVPFARFVVQHQNEISFPFKRYQIQPVWRADRPQHGRYQEFYQCDADVVGSKSLLYEVDFVQIFDEVLTSFQIPSFTILINNRKILSGIAEVSGQQDKLIDITVAIDKLDKIGQEGVEKELIEKGISVEAIEIIRPLFNLTGNNDENLAQISQFLASSEIGLKGIEELKFVLDQTTELGLEKAELKFDVTLARGLNYYTGAIFEVKVNDIKMGSICGGGRYDDLTGLFGMPDVSGVGISFGADRIYDVLTELELFPTDTDKGLKLLFVNFGEKEQLHCMKLVKEIRQNGIDCELYPTAAKMQKQMKYANDIRVQYVALVGENEMNENLIQLKNMESGEQKEMSLEEVIFHLGQI